VGVGLGIGLSGSPSDSDRLPLPSGFNTVGSTPPAALGGAGVYPGEPGGWWYSHPPGGSHGGGGCRGCAPCRQWGLLAVGLHASNSNPSLNSGEGTSSKSAPTAAPCGACKFLRR